MQTETQKPGPGLSGKGCKKHNRKRLLDAFLDVPKLRNFQKSSSRMQQTVDVLWICIFRQRHACECRLLVSLHILRVRLLHICSFYEDGQCEGLGT